MSPRRPLGPRHCANSIDPPTRDKHSGRNTSSATIAHTPHPYYTPVHRARRPGAYLTLPLPLSTYNFLHTVTAVHWSLFCINLEFRQSHFLRILVTDVDNVSIYCYHVFVYLLFSKIFFSSHIHILYFCFFKPHACYENRFTPSYMSGTNLWREQNFNDQVHASPLNMCVWQYPSFYTCRI